MRKADGGTSVMWRYRAAGVAGALLVSIAFAVAPAWAAQWTPAGTISTGSDSFLEGIDTAPNGDLWVVSGQQPVDGVIRVATDGTIVDTVGGVGSAPGEFMGPAAVAVAPDGTFFVTDVGNDRIQRFADDGSFLSQFGSTGDGPGQVDNPRGIAVAPDGTVYVADSASGYVNKWTSGGTFLGTLGTVSQYGAPFGIGIDRDGNIWVTDVTGGKVRKVAPDGTVLLTLDGFGQPADVDFTGDDAVIVDLNAHTVVTYTLGGALVDTLGFGSTFVSRVAVGADGRLYASLGGPSIAVFAPPPTDTTGPVVASTVAGTLGSNGWYRGPGAVTVSWSVSDPETAISAQSGCGTGSVAADTAGTTFTCTATSGGGTTTGSVTVKRDATPPTAVYAAHAASYTVDQTVSFGCTSSDALSGVATPCQGVGAPASSFPPGPVTVSSTAVDAAGNTATATTSFTVSVTAASLCNLTRQIVHASPRYATATVLQRLTADAVVSAGCLELELDPARTHPRLRRPRWSRSTRSTSPCSRSRAG